MSRPRVITGVDDRGRPITEWAPATVATQSYGHMEPAHVATVERRQATPEELDAAREREAAPSPLVRSPGVIVSRHHRPELVVDATEPDSCAGPLDALAAAVGRAADAWTEKCRAEHEADMAALAWQEARRALDEAYQALDAPQAATSAPVPAPTPARRPPARQKAEPKRRRPGGGDTRDKAIAENAARVLEVLERHNGNTKAAGAELGLRGNVVGRIARAARDRAAREQAVSA
jgi:hypothetical protein